MSSATATPLISVISITLNDRDGLQRTVQSLQSQTDAPSYEHIIVDGVSDYEVAGLLAELGSNARLHRCHDKGLYDAMNTGTELACGDYILYLNSGDTLADTRVLAEISAVLASERPDFLYGDSFECQFDGEVQYKPSRKLTRLPLGMIIHHQAMLFRREVIRQNEIRYNLCYRIAADYDFVLHHVRASATTRYLPRPICVFEGGGISYQERHAARRELFQIRRGFYHSTLFAVAVFIAQWHMRSFRDLFPAGYWSLRKRLGKG